MNHTRNPAQDTKRDIDEKISRATTLHSDRKKGNPYSEEVKENGALTSILVCVGEAKAGKGKEI
jgi:hypothetical protein